MSWPWASGFGEVCLFSCSWPWYSRLTDRAVGRALLDVSKGLVLNKHTFLLLTNIVVVLIYNYQVCFVLFTRELFLFGGVPEETTICADLHGYSWALRTLKEQHVGNHFQLAGPTNVQMRGKVYCLREGTVLLFQKLRFNPRAPIESSRSLDRKSVV